MLNLVRGAKRLATAPRAEQQSIVTAVRMTPRIARSLKLDGYARTRAWLENLEPPDFGDELPVATLRRADKAIRVLPWSMKCLERSLAIWWIAGERAVIRLGVAPASGGEEHRFHAWVERDGVVVNDARDIASEFLPLAGHGVKSPDPQLFD
jgi:hypothetical protein